MQISYTQTSDSLLNHILYTNTRARQVRRHTRICTLTFLCVAARKIFQAVQSMTFFPKLRNHKLPLLGLVSRVDAVEVMAL